MLPQLNSNLNSCGSIDPSSGTAKDTKLLLLRDDLCSTLKQKQTVPPLGRSIRSEGGNYY